MVVLGCKITQTHTCTVYGDFTDAVIMTKLLVIQRWFHCG